ncbi:hypothetical protein ACTMSW_27825 [Micromonospora sp. BQ11]|uniref:hypothetical protein n=1 Tax=Micromonospora sp. BQ11 TaxID=3452212 RepID=UPI003F8C3657
MGRRMPFVAMLVLGGVLLGTVGLSVGSWWGGRGSTPLEPERARVVAAELLPTVEPTGSSTNVRAARYGVLLATDDFGSGRIEFQYGERADCGLSDQLRRNATAQGWQGLRRVSAGPCDGWRAEKRGLTAMLTHRSTGSTLGLASAAPDGFLAATVTGTLIGAATGATLFGLLARRRPPVPLLAGTLATVGLLPGVVPTWWDLSTTGLAEPVWPIWPALAPLLVPLWLVFLLVGWIVASKRTTRTGPTAAPATGEPAIR